MAFIESINLDYVLGFVQLVTAVAVVLIANVQRKQSKKCAGCGTVAAAPQRVVARERK